MRKVNREVGTAGRPHPGNPPLGTGGAWTPLKKKPIGLSPPWGYGGVTILYSTVYCLVCLWLFFRHFFVSVVVVFWYSVCFCDFVLIIFVFFWSFFCITWLYYGHTYNQVLPGTIWKPNRPRYGTWTSLRSTYDFHSLISISIITFFDVHTELNNHILQFFISNIGTISKH